MSRQLVSLSPDLSRLESEGFDIEIRDVNLLVKDVPYVTSSREVAYGVLVSELSTNGAVTIAPNTHEIWFAGSLPCDNYGNEIPLLINQRTQFNFGPELVCSFSFSRKPLSGRYDNYYDKITSYVRILSAYARAIDPKVTAKIFPVREAMEDESVFRYLDAATSRAGISAITSKLKIEKVGIVGLGGTGSYILDLLAKTPIGEIHLYDDDVIYAHNAFRMPGAASIEELQTVPQKVQYLQCKYDPMRRGIVGHPSRVSRSNIDELRGLSFVFLSMDTGSAKQFIIESLLDFGIPFIDCGMGVYRTGDSLGGIVRVTSGDSARNSHLENRISYGDQAEDEYDWNIQTADLNMLNATMAVIKWKKWYGFYLDAKGELNSTYTVARNQMVSGEIVQ